MSLSGSSPASQRGLSGRGLEAVRTWLSDHGFSPCFRLRVLEAVGRSLQPIFPAVCSPHGMGPGPMLSESEKPEGSKMGFSSVPLTLDLHMSPPYLTTRAGFPKSNAKPSTCQKELLQCTFPTSSFSHSLAPPHTQFKQPTQTAASISLHT